MRADSNPPPPLSFLPDQEGSSPEPSTRAQAEGPRAASYEYPAAEGPATAGPGQPSVTPLRASGSGGSRKAAWDVVVVGGGIGGLAAASVLAKAGRAVLLLEASARLGGACLGISRDGHRYDVGVGPITGAVRGGAVATLCERLGIDLPTIPCDPTVQIALPEHRIGLSLAHDGWWQGIRREFPDDEAGWHDLVSDLTSLAEDREAVARRLPPLPPEGRSDRVRCWSVLALRGVAAGTRRAVRQLRSAEETSFRETLQAYSLGAASRQALEACLWYLLLRGSDESSTLEAALALQRLREGAVVVPDGPAALVDRLAQRLGEYGGEIRLQTAATRCVAERGRIVGVTTRAGETIRARWVVTDVPPGILMEDLWPTRRRWLRRRHPPQRSWEPRCVAQILGVAIPEAFLPSELGWHCLVVPDCERPARDENLVFVRRTPQERQEGAGLAHLSVGRFVPPSTPAAEPAVARALLQALDQVIPGVADVTVHQWVLSPAALGELWGRPMATVRYDVEPRAWLGRRGWAHQVGWPGLLAVGEWTYPGRLMSDVVEGAMHVVDRILALG